MISPARYSVFNVSFVTAKHRVYGEVMQLPVVTRGELIAEEYEICLVFQLDMVHNFSRVRYTSF